MSLFRPSARHVSIGVTILRVATAAVFINHGWQKVFGFGFAGVTGAFTQMGAPLPGITGPLVAVLECFGAIALLLGFLTRPIALALAVDMLGAIVIVQLKNGFSHYELEFMLLAAGLTLALTGAGAASIDGVLADRRGGTAGAPRT